MTAATYAGPLSAGVSASFNSVFLGEVLNSMQWFSIGGLFLSGLIFLIFGHGRNLDKKEQLCLLALILSTLGFNGIDHFVISQSSWFVPFVLFPIGLLLSCLSKPKQFLGALPKIFTKHGALYGLLFVVTDIMVLLPLITVLPVSVLFVLGLGLIPVKMMLFSWLFNEGKPTQQFLLGMIASFFSFLILAYG